MTATAQDGRHKRQGRALVMDDEELVRRVAAEMLRYLGFQVDEAGSGREAVALFEKAWKGEEPYTLAVLDLTVPGGMGGKETVKELLAIDPQLKAIVSSGYADDPIMTDFRGYGFVAVVPKPYKVQELRTVLEKVFG